MQNTPQDSPVVVDESATITPITHQPIKAVHGNQWTAMSISQLRIEQSTLRSRQLSLESMGKGGFAQQLEQGIQQIEAIITEKYRRADETRK